METKTLLYENIAADIAQQISQKTLRMGDKLPSLREICERYRVSQTTALQAYYQLEAKSLVESRPRSGYFVCGQASRTLPLPTVSAPGPAGGNAAHELISRVYGDMGRGGAVPLSMGVPALELLPVAKLNKGLVQASRTLPGSGLEYEQVQGNENLRRQLARFYGTSGQALTSNDIVVASGCMEALSLSLMAVTRRGDTLAVESPVYFGILQLAQSLGLNVVELPTHPQTGVEIDALKKVLTSGKIHACLLVSNFNNPLGSCMPDTHKQEVVRLIQHYGIPLIEDDIYGEVYFGSRRPRSCRSFDDSGLVMWCSSVSKTLAPGYRIGWVAPGRFKAQVLRLKLYHTITGATITQQVIAQFLETGRYAHHLRGMRQVLHANSLRYAGAIGDYFPEGTRVSRPGGGFMLWVELDPGVDTAVLYDLAMRQQISIAPGSMFSLQNQFTNCLRLSYGMPWNTTIGDSLKRLGRLIAAL
ncbi:PLP-dependent aminotransferase family protein [Pedobacter sp. JY14-1]|uniref:aminotransferase-like domain-containing protein n=1 Tax=Pedobacter sp. JY14-1 TaxID=3034151 RepID=UPI0023E27DB3|nr:PLP-dependent aminotransferase family protein [Pedobacter sp. JY14-1]